MVNLKFISIHCNCINLLNRITSISAFHKAGKPQEAFKVLEQLTMNAVNENRFDDAGYYYWMLSMQCLDLAAEDESTDDETEALIKDEDLEDKNKALMDKFKDYQKRASMYYVYHTIQRYMVKSYLL